MACWKIRHLQLFFSMKASIYSGLSVAIFAYWRVNHESQIGRNKNGGHEYMHRQSEIWWLDHDRSVKIWHFLQREKEQQSPLHSGAPIHLPCFDDRTPSSWLLNHFNGINVVMYLTFADYKVTKFLGQTIMSSWWLNQYMSCLTPQFLLAKSQFVAILGGIILIPLMNFNIGEPTWNLFFVKSEFSGEYMSYFTPQKITGNPINAHEHQLDVLETCINMYQWYPNSIHKVGDIFHEIP